MHDGDRRGELGRAAHVVFLEMGGDEIVDLPDPILPGELNEAVRNLSRAGIQQHHLAGRRDHVALPEPTSTK